MEASLQGHDGLNHWPRLTDSTPHPSLLPGGKVGRLKVPPFRHRVGSPSNQPRPPRTKKIIFININPMVVEITRHPSHLYGSEAFSETEEETTYNRREAQCSSQSENSKGLETYDLIVLQIKNEGQRHLRKIFWSSE